MAITEMKNFSSNKVKSLVLAGALISPTAVLVSMSKSELAKASVDSNKLEGCIVKMQEEPAPAAPEFYSPASYTATTEVPEDRGLFWNPLNKSWMTDEQIDLLQLAYQVGYEDGGEKHAELLQAILLQETIAGRLGRMGHMTAPVGKRSYGVMQVKVTAARDMLRKHNEFGEFKADELLIAKLLMDDEFNMRIASKFLLHLKQNSRSIDQALVAYNIGLRASQNIDEPKSFKYVVRARRHLTEVIKPFNERFVDIERFQVAMR